MNQEILNILRILKSIGFSDMHVVDGGALPIISPIKDTVLVRSTYEFIIA
jgi:hypothetical protein